MRLSCVASRLVNLAPTLEEGLADTMYTRLGTMVVVRDISHHLLRRSSVGRSEGLVPLGEDELVKIGNSML